VEGEKRKKKKEDLQENSWKINPRAGEVRSRAEVIDFLFGKIPPRV